eukprot:scaffold124337_cov30-Tisochrysis_lutea.AAC.1
MYSIFGGGAEGIFISTAPPLLLLGDGGGHNKKERGRAERQEKEVGVGKCRDMSRVPSLNLPVPLDLPSSLSSLPPYEYSLSLLLSFSFPLSFGLCQPPPSLAGRPHPQWLPSYDLCANSRDPLCST